MKVTDSMPVGTTLRRCMDLVPIPLLLLLTDTTASGRQHRRIFHINSAFREQIGYALEDMPHIDDWWRLAYPDEAYREQIARRWVETIDASLSHDGGAAELEALIQCGDGEQRWFVATVELADDILPGANMVAFRNVHNLKVSLQVTDRMAHTDALTGLLNRFAAERELERAWAAFTHHGETFAVAMCDVDWFRQVNDEHGHDAGDYALRMIAKCLTDGIRSNDYAVRWGGDEFLLLLAEPSPPAVMGALERVRKAVADNDWRWKGARLPLSLSIGGTVVSWHKSLADLLADADAALYVAKREGRNRVCMHPPVPTD